GSTAEVGGGGGSFVNAADIDAFTVKDGGGEVGNADDGFVIYTFRDTNAPTVECKDVTVTLGPGNIATFTPDQMLDAVHIAPGDDFDKVRFTIGGANFDELTAGCSDVGQSQLTLSLFTDDLGLAASCSGTVTVLDEVAPVVNCTNFSIAIIVSPGNDFFLPVSTVISGNPSDACGSVVSTYLSQNVFTCDDVGQIHEVILYAEDESGNRGSCTAEIGVAVDGTTLICPASMTVDTDPNSCVWNFQDELLPSTCGPGTPGYSIMHEGTTDAGPGFLAGLAFDPGLHEITYAYAKPNGQTDECSFTVQVNHNQVLTAMCHDQTIYLNNSGQAFIASEVVGAGSVDACGNLAVTIIDQEAFDCSHLGENEVTVTAFDGDNHTDQCTATITVEDPIAPIVDCDGFLTTAIDPISCQVDYDIPEPGIGDNCGLPTLQQRVRAANADGTPADGSSWSAWDGGTTRTLGQGHWRIEWQGTDPGGNQSSCFLVVTAENPEPIEAVCQNLTVQLDGDGQAAIQASALDGGSMGSCSSLGLAASQTAFDCSEIGVNDVTLTVTNTFGDTDDCTAQVTVEYGGGLTAVCQDITVNLDANGTASINPEEADGGSYDSCDGLTFQVSQDAFDCNEIGLNEITLVVINNYGASAECTAQVTIADNQVPMIVNCPTEMAVSAGVGSCTAVVNWTPPTLIDNCPGSLIASHDSGSTFDVGATTVTYTSTDAAGNTATPCSFTVTINDTEAPTALCQDLTIALNGAGNAYPPAGDIDNGSTDNCAAGNDLTLSLSPASFNCTTIGDQTVTLTATDLAGLSSSCTATVTVVDQTAPYFAGCPTNIYTGSAEGFCGAFVSWTPPHSGDNCGINELTISHEQGDFFPVGATTVTYQASDASGNTNECTFRVTIFDAEDPVAQCQDVTVYLDDNGSATVPAAELDGGSSDNCGNFIYNTAQYHFDCGDTGTNEVTLIVVDEWDNYTSCTAQVTVVDDQAPVVSGCPNNILTNNAAGGCTATVNWTSPTASDNCGLASFTPSHSPGTAFGLGATTVTYTATDAAGNENTDCSFTVTVEDTEAPVLTQEENLCGTTVPLTNAPGSCSRAFAWTPPGYVDNCGVVSFQSSIGGQSITPITLPNGQAQFVFPIGSTTVSYVAADAAGNESICAFTVVVSDGEAPTISCSTTELVFNGESSIPLDAEALTSASDNCGTPDVSLETAFIHCEAIGQTVDVLATATDQSGLSSQCIITVDVTGLPCGWVSEDEHIDCPGSHADYSPESETYYLTSADCSHAPYSPYPEAYAFGHTTLCGDGEIIAHVASLDGLGKAWAGIVMRESHDPGSKKFQLMTGLDYLSHRVDWRTTSGGMNQTQNFGRFGQHWLRIVRSGPIFQAYTSHDGISWSAPVNTQVIQMETCLEVGLVVTNIPYATNVTASFDQVQVIPPYQPVPRPETPAAGMYHALDLTVYPNPTSGLLTVDLTAFLDHEASLQVMNLQGRIVLLRQLGIIGSPAERLDLSPYPAGIYLIRLRTAQGVTAVQRVIVQGAGGYPRP
ncbi:MAG: HYR domain-containing protein, partial [Lewinella sp.]|nr:HYR domain-containing protein [Lewinella sp.]